MNQIEGRGAAEPEAAPAGSVAELVSLVASVYEHADPDLRHAVRNTLQAGIPASVLTSDLSQHP